MKTGKSGEFKSNPTVTAFFADDRWGDGNFISMPIDAKAFDAIQNAGLNDRLLFKVTNRQSKNGSQLAYLEIIKPRFDSKTTAKTAKNDDL